jgi:hypothetical protein
VKRGEWLALNFKEGSVSHDAAFQADVTEGRAREFNRLVEFITDFDPEIESTNNLVSDATLFEYGRIGEHIDPDEVVGVGLYTKPGRRPNRWRQINYRKASRIRQAIEAPLLSYGSIQGLMHSLIMLGARPYFQLREQATDNLIRCLYADALYPIIVDALRERNAIVHATGHMNLDRAKRSVTEMNVERIDRVTPLTDDEFVGLFGSAPRITGDLTTEQFIEQIRGDG